jgi:DNA-binding MarR family transcriptional regulator
VSRLPTVGPDIAQQLESALNRLMLPGNRGPLCAPAIEAAPSGVDGQTWPVLQVLGRLGPSSVARVAQEIGMDRSGASRHASRLEDLGFVQRTADLIDRRAALLSLTDEGQNVFDELSGRLADYLHEMLRDWPRGQAEMLVDGIERMIAWGRSAASRAEWLQPTYPAEGPTVGCPEDLGPADA